MTISQPCNGRDEMKGYRMNTNKTELMTTLCSIAIGALACGVAVASEPQPNREVQDVFFSPTVEPEKVHGEPAIWFDRGTYYMVYDYWPHPLPFGMATSKDGVHWRDHGFMFAKDEDVKDIECAYVYRFQPDGPWVMQYAFRKKPPYPSFRMRFAVSDDSRTWKKLGPESNFLPDPRWYTDGRWDTISPCPKGDGEHYGAWDAVPNVVWGLGFGKTRNGIHWEILPPVEVDVPRVRRTGIPGEIGGFFKMGNRYFIEYADNANSSPLAGSIRIVTSEKPEGPYRPTPRNHYWPRYSFIYPRFYDLPGGNMYAEMFHVRRDGRRSYHMPPLKLVESDGESIWLKWWDGNNRLKSQPIEVSVPVPSTRQETAWLHVVPEKLAGGKGVVVEGKLRLESNAETAKNLACDATATAVGTLESELEGADFFAPGKAVDGDPSSGWIGQAPVGETVSFHLDLGGGRQVGRIMLHATGVPDRVETSSDGAEWRALPGRPDVLSCRNGTFVCYWEDLVCDARYIRITEKTAKQRKWPGYFGIIDAGVYSEPNESIIGRPALVLRREGERDFAIVIGRDGTVRFGGIDKDGTHFRWENACDIDVDFGNEADFRLILREDMGEFYVNDYHIALINVSGPNPLTGQICFTGDADGCHAREVKAWNTAPDYSRTNK
jgi:hypothetical protein